MTNQSFQRGLEAYERGDFEAALREWRPLAEQGLAEAQYRLGEMYGNDEGVECDDDDAEYERWVRKAAEQGLPEAQITIGNHIIWTDDDHTEALSWYRKAAEQGNMEGQYVLGMKYSTSDGVDQDLEEATKWFKRAAERDGLLHSGEEVGEFRLRDLAFVGIVQHITFRQRADDLVSISIRPAVGVRAKVISRAHGSPSLRCQLSRGEVNSLGSARSRKSSKCKAPRPRPLGPLVSTVGHPPPP